MEVIYTGMQQTPQMIVEAAIQEDVDVIGLSILSGAHMTLLPKVTQGLRAEGADDVLVLAGGIISDADAEILRRDHGIAAVYGPGASTHDIIRFITEQIAPTSRSL
jgi:methylmalonyl-CoA mutase C-terminal domain/subunit